MRAGLLDLAFPAHDLVAAELTQRVGDHVAIVVGRDFQKAGLHQLTSPESEDRAQTLVDLQPAPISRRDAQPDGRRLHDHVQPRVVGFEVRGLFLGAALGCAHMLHDFVHRSSDDRQHSHFKDRGGEVRRRPEMDDAEDQDGEHRHPADGQQLGAVVEESR